MWCLNAVNITSAEKIFMLHLWSESSNCQKVLKYVFSILAFCERLFMFIISKCKPQEELIKVNKDHLNEEQYMLHGKKLNTNMRQVPSFLGYHTPEIITGVFFDYVK